MWSNHETAEALTKQSSHKIDLWISPRFFVENDLQILSNSYSCVRLLAKKDACKYKQYSRNPFSWLRETIACT